MFSAIRTHLSYANVAATMALVFALTGGAFAATSHPGGGSAGSKASASVTPVASTAKKKAAPKSTRGPAGPKGATGPTGPAGPAGATGPAGGTGPQGPQGSAGNNGSNGEKGEPGTSVTSEKVKKGEAMCEKEGGSKFTSASGTTSACNGKEGSPWTAGGTLPPEKTETGAWSYGEISKTAAGGGKLVVPVASFAIPLANPLSGAGCGEEPATRTEPCQVHFINPSGKEVIFIYGTTEREEEIEPSVVGACLGSVETPTAAPGNLCVYARKVYESSTDSGRIASPAKGLGAGTTGALESFNIEGQFGEGFGTWAVTAPAA